MRGRPGGALAHDLALRRVQLTLLERGELTSGTTGRHHGLLHSGARHAAADAESAVECIQENRILRRIAPWRAPTRTWSPANRKAPGRPLVTGPSPLPEQPIAALR